MPKGALCGEDDDEEEVLSDGEPEGEGLLASEALRRRLAPPFHQFLTALSERPLRRRAMSAHFLPWVRTSCSM